MSTSSMTKSFEKHQPMWDSTQPGDIVVLEGASVASTCATR
jgi:hypothetical protein